MKIRNALSVFLSAIVALSIAGCSGCKDKEKSVVKPNVFSAVSDSKIQLYDEIKVEAAEGVKEEKIVWTSSDTEILVVENGEVFAKSTGVATLKAEYQGDTQTQSITVYDDGLRPVIHTEDIPLLLGSTFETDFAVTFNGMLWENVEYVLSSSAPSIVSAEGNVLSAISYGSAEITVKASYKGIEDIATGSFQCKVNANEGIITNRARYNLYAQSELLGKTYESSIPLSADAFVDGNLHKNVAVNWTIEDENIVTLSEGVLYAKNLGETVLTGEYTINGKTLKTRRIPLVVSPLLQTTNAYILVDKRQEYCQIDAKSLFGKEVNIGALVASTGKTLSAVENKIETDNLFSGEARYTVYSDDGVYGLELDMIVADYVVYDKGDLAKLSTFTDGYIALANNIDDVGEHNPEQPWNSITSPAFGGTFNGLGHTLSGMVIKSANCGLFVRLGTCTIKNVAVTNFTIESGSGSAAFAFRCEGMVRVDNVLVECTYGSSYASAWSGGAFAFIYSGSIQASNSLFITTGLQSTESVRTRNGGFVGRIDARGSLELTNAYVVTDGDICATGTHASNVNYAVANAKTSYATTEAFVKTRKENAERIDLSGFNLQYWDLSKDVPCFYSFVVDNSIADVLEFDAKLFL